jgi:hypothetical protein
VAGGAGAGRGGRRHRPAGPGRPGVGDAGRRRIGRDQPGLGRDSAESRKKAARFIDNGWYVGHDEPSVKFISNAAGSGNTMTYFMKLPVDPKRKPTANGRVTSYAELSLAPWFGLPICDPRSYPQNPCTPNSDSNIGTNTAGAAGSALMELQFYPPGFTPFPDSASCSATQWCGALTIDSLECSYGHGGGDLTTGRTGYMTASARNGFMNTSMSNCDGHPFTFHAEYNTARKQNMHGRLGRAAQPGRGPVQRAHRPVLSREDTGHHQADRLPDPGFRQRPAVRVRRRLLLPQGQPPGPDQREAGPGARVCLWNFGGTIPGQTVRDFGKDAQYGAPDLSFYGGTLISQVQPNPQFSGKCR